MALLIRSTSTAPSTETINRLKRSSTSSMTITVPRPETFQYVRSASRWKVPTFLPKKARPGPRRPRASRRALRIDGGAADVHQGDVDLPSEAPQTVQTVRPDREPVAENADGVHGGSPVPCSPWSDETDWWDRRFQPGSGRAVGHPTRFPVASVLSQLRSTDPADPIVAVCEFQQGDEQQIQPHRWWSLRRTGVEDGDEQSGACAERAVQAAALDAGGSHQIVDRCPLNPSGRTGLHRSWSTWSVSNARVRAMEPRVADN